MHERGCHWSKRWFVLFAQCHLQSKQAHPASLRTYGQERVPLVKKMVRAFCPVPPAVKAGSPGESSNLCTREGATGQKDGSCFLPSATCSQSRLTRRVYEPMDKRGCHWSKRWFVLFAQCHLQSKQAHPASLATYARERVPLVKKMVRAFCPVPPAVKAGSPGESTNLWTREGATGQKDGSCFLPSATCSQSRLTRRV